MTAVQGRTEIYEECDQSVNQSSCQEYVEKSAFITRVPFTCFLIFDADVFLLTAPGPNPAGASAFKEDAFRPQKRRRQ